MPGFWLMRIVELLSGEKQFPIRDEPCVEPEVEGTFLIVFRNIVGAGLEEDPGVSLQDRTVDSLDCELVRAGVVAGLAVNLRRTKL